MAKDTSRTNPTKSFAQVTASAVNILKIKEAFPALPDKKIIEIHNTALNKPTTKGKKIQATTKGPSKKQVIVPLHNKYTNRIIKDVSSWRPLHHRYCIAISGGVVIIVWCM